MTNAQHDVAASSLNRKWTKVGITSFSFIAAVFGAFYLGSRHNTSSIGNAPQSAVTHKAPAHAPQVPADVRAPVRPAQALDTHDDMPLTDRDVYARDLAEPTSAQNAAYMRDNAWQRAEDAATRRAPPSIKDALIEQAVSKFLCRNVGPKPDGSGPCAAQADAENRLTAAGWCFVASSDNPGAPYWHDCVTAVDHLSDDNRQNRILHAANKALMRATPAIRALLAKEAVANESCRGSNDQATIERECAIRARLEAALDKAGWCYGRSDDTSAADSYWHDCKW
jgi:hypothetical protein